MTQGDRIKAIRKHFKLTMEKFGNKLGVTKVAISNIEKGNRNLTEQMSKAICREFNVNEDWLKTGNGEMFAPTDKFNLNDYMKSRGATDLEMELMRAYFDLDEDVRKEIMEHFVTKFSKAAQKNPAAFVPDTPEELEKIAQLFSSWLSLLSTPCHTSNARSFVRKSYLIRWLISFVLPISYSFSLTLSPVACILIFPDMPVRLPSFKWATFLSASVGFIAEVSASLLMASSTFPLRVIVPAITLSVRSFSAKLPFA